MASVGDRWQVARRAKKKHRVNAEIAGWLNIDATKLDEESRVGLYANIGRIKAQRRIHEGSYDPTDFKGVYSLFLTAFDDERIAQDAAVNAAERLVDSKTAP